MKIAVLGTRGFPDIQGGIEAHCENLYPRLRKKDCRIVVFTRKKYVSYPHHLLKRVGLVSLSSPRQKYFEALWHTFKGVFVARRIKPDILHIHAIGPSLFVPLARILGMKVVITHHGPDYERKKWGKIARLVLRIGEFAGCLCANQIIAVSDNIAEHVRKKYGKNPIVIYNGVITAEILKSEDVLRKYQLTKSKYIVAVGRVVPEKGFHDLIKAFNKIEDKGWKLVIAGRADHEDNYSKELKKMALSNNNIVLTGFLSGKALQELYSHAGLFVLPSYYEGMPIVLLEAMSYGLCCITSEIPANYCVGLPKENYFTPGDIGSLTKKIEHFIGVPLSEDKKKKQMEMIKQKYNWDFIAQETLRVYSKVLRTHEKKHC